MIEEVKVTEQSIRPKLYRGDLYYMNFGQDGNERSNNTRSSIQRGERPGVICQSKYGMNSNTILVAPVSSQIRKDYPFLQQIDLDKKSQIHYEQPRPIDVWNIQRYIGRLNTEQLREMDIRLSIPLGLDACNFLHIESVKIYKKYSKDGIIMFKGKLNLLFGTRHFEFSILEYKSYFSMEFYPLVEESGLTNLSMFMETIHGLKFIYNFVN